MVLKLPHIIVCTLTLPTHLFSLCCFSLKDGGVLGTPNALREERLGTVSLQEIMCGSLVEFGSEDDLECQSPHESEPLFEQAVHCARGEWEPSGVQTARTPANVAAFLAQTLAVETACLWGTDEGPWLGLGGAFMDQEGVVSALVTCPPEMLLENKDILCEEDDGEEAEARQDEQREKLEDGEWAEAFYRYQRGQGGSKVEGDLYEALHEIYLAKGIWTASPIWDIAESPDADDEDVTSIYFVE